MLTYSLASAASESVAAASTAAPANSARRCGSLAHCTVLHTVQLSFAQRRISVQEVSSFGAGMLQVTGKRFWSLLPGMPLEGHFRNERLPLGVIWDAAGFLEAGTAQ